jgi:hypothetical protein
MIISCQKASESLPKHDTRGGSEKVNGSTEGLLRIPSNRRELRKELFECREMSELTCFKPEPRASPISQPARSR